MLTKEQIRAKGTELPVYNRFIPYTTADYVRAGTYKVPTSVIEKGYKILETKRLVVFDTVTKEDITWVMMDIPNYEENNYYAVDIKELQKAGIVEGDKIPTVYVLKEGDKVKIPKTKQGRSEGVDWTGFQEEMKGYNLDYMVITGGLGNPNNVSIDRDDAGHVSWNSFCKDDLELYEEPDFVLPEKWSIRGGPALAKAGFGEWTNGHGRENHWVGNGKYYYNFNGTFIRSSSKIPHNPVITLDQFIQYVLKQPKTDAMLKKVIGFELIKTYPGWESLGVQLEHQSESTWYIKGTGTSYGVLSPDRYPEFWKPIFEEDIKVGDWAIAVHNDPSHWAATAFEVAKVGNNSGSGHYIYHKDGYNGDYKSFRKATPEEIEIAKKKNEISFAGYKAEKTEGGVKFGCKAFTRDQIDFLLFIISNGDIAAEVTILGEEITPAFLGRIRNFITQ